MGRIVKISQDLFGVFLYRIDYCVNTQDWQTFVLILEAVAYGGIGVRRAPSMNVFVSDITTCLVW